MKQYIEITCRHCGTGDLARNGRGENGTRRYRCNQRGKSFQHQYTYYLKEYRDLRTEKKAPAAKHFVSVFRNPHNMISMMIRCTGAFTVVS